MPWPHAALPKARSAFVAAVPFVYLLCVYKLVKTMTNPHDSVGKSVRKNTAGSRPISFDDVAGQDAAVAELRELVTFLHDRSAYDAMGARLPRGVLLSGPAGTGKTLLARALASEASCSFIFVSASEFVETLVGRGAARVRDLFKRARAKAPAIVFIDEIDALAKARGGLHSNDEREQTLNQVPLQPAATPESRH